MPRLCVELVEIQPVCSLRNGDKVCAAGSDRETLGRMTQIEHTRVRDRLGKLPGACVTRQHLIKMHGKVDCGLAIAGGKIERQCA